MANPLLEHWDTPFETPPFHLIEPAYFKPAIEEAIRSATEEINSIAENSEPASFDNTVGALERSAELLGRITLILYNLNSADTSKEIQAAAQDSAPLLSRFSNDITLNATLFKRIKAVWDQRDSLALCTEDKMLLEKKYRSFLLGGALLDDSKKARFREISEELSKLTLKFEENVLEETNAFELQLTDKDNLAGLPRDVVNQAAAEASNRKKEGWVFTLNYPSYIPFMQYSEKRELREKMLKAYTSRAFHGNERDNRSLVVSIVNYRLEMAKMLGFRNFAEMILGDRMADTPEKVQKFLEDLFKESHKGALRDLRNIEEFASGMGHHEGIERWDWAYYSEKLKKAMFKIDDEVLKPYFSLDKAREAVFVLASKLYGLSFRENKGIPVYNDEVHVWEVFDNHNEILAILYLDFHPRKGKNGGAWMTAFREQKIINGRRIIPLISVVSNFARPSLDKPSLLTFTELTTFLHEFGHALHGMLSQCRWESLSGTSVARDFVELPSQIMENWAFEQEWLDTWAEHYETGEKIPGEYVQRIKEASAFNEGYACDRQLGFAFLDMAWHKITQPVTGNIEEIEAAALEKTELFPKIKTSNMSCSFTHLFGGGYAAGYYGYKWAEVLDADAFSLFREKGIFNREIARSFRENILEKGGSDKPMNLYLKFRGKEPTMDAFLERSGLKLTSSP
ncbi:MAG: M3 family metallopeptidase [Bacteroidota bacterium]|nr:M3 family metallopeptidase [Bacteroidota bacterium]